MMGVTLTYKNGSVYEGEWENGERHCTGRFVDASRQNAVYTGQWDRGERCGAGEARPTGQAAASTFAGKWSGSAMIAGTVALEDGTGGYIPTAARRGRLACHLSISSGVPQFVSRFTPS